MIILLLCSCFFHPIRGYSRYNSGWGTALHYGVDDTILSTGCGIYLLFLAGFNA